LLEGLRDATESGDSQSCAKIFHLNHTSVEPVASRCLKADLLSETMYQSTDTPIRESWAASETFRSLHEDISSISTALEDAQKAAHYYRANMNNTMARYADLHVHWIKSQEAFAESQLRAILGLAGRCRDSYRRVACLKKTPVAIHTCHRIYFDQDEASNLADTTPGHPPVYNLHSPSSRVFPFMYSCIQHSARNREPGARLFDVMTHTITMDRAWTRPSWWTSDGSLYVGADRRASFGLTYIAGAVTLRSHQGRPRAGVMPKLGTTRLLGSSADPGVS